MVPGLQSGVIETDVDDGILTVTINRPESRNAMTRTMCADLIDVIAWADANDRVRAIIMTGVGRSFCAGADVKGNSRTMGVATSDEPRLPPGRDFGGVLTLRMFASNKLIVGAVNGDAVGVGASVLLPMDVRIASTTARFGFVQVRRGIVPEACSSWFLPRIVGIATAVDWACSGRLIQAEEAHRARLVDAIVEPADLLEAARERAISMITDTPATPVAVTRRMLWNSLTLTSPVQAHLMESAFVRELGSMPDAREGIASFLERRAPEFTSAPSEDIDGFESWWTDTELRG